MYVCVLVVSCLWMGVCLNECMKIQSICCDPLQFLFDLLAERKVFTTKTPPPPPPPHPPFPPLNLLERLSGQHKIDLPDMLQHVNVVWESLCTGEFFFTFHTSKASIFWVISV